MTIVAGGALCSKPAWALQAAPEEKLEADAPVVAPIRGLMKRDGKLVQPIDVTIRHSGQDAAVVTKLDGVEADRRVLSDGQHTFQIYAEPVSAARDASVAIAIGEKSTVKTVPLQPVRKLRVYILPHSHHDLGYTDQQADVEVKQMRNISEGIALARKTADYPEGARFVWNLEVLWGADLFMRRKSQAEQDEFVEAVKKGWVSLNGMYANELTGLCRPEELLQLLRYSTELGKQCGVQVNSAMQSDVPGFTWGTVTAMSQAGIRYFSAAPNFFDRIGTFMVEWQDKPFWWVSPSGNEKVLMWVPWTGYAMSHVMKANPEWVGKYQDRLDSVKFPYEISYIRWSGHGDNAAPDPEISEFVKSWNESYEWPKFHISSTSEAFSAFEERHGKELPEFKGDLTPYWEDGAGSSALETRINRAAADRLTQAAALSAMLTPGAYRPKDYHEAWRDVLRYSEHTWVAWCSVSDSESAFTTKQWDVKRDFAVDAEKRSKDLMAATLQAYGKGTDGSAIDVHNATSWARTELVSLPADMSAAGDLAKDAHGVPVASQRLSTGELVFLTHEVPAFASARYHVSAGKAHAPAARVKATPSMLDNGVIRVGIDAQTGNVVELTAHGTNANLIDTAGGHSGNEYLFLEGKDISKLQRSGAAKVTVEEAGPLVASLRIESSAPGTKNLVRRVRLTAGADYVELSNAVDKTRAPLNPNPGKGGPGDEFAQRGSKESVQFGFPFAVAGGQIRMDIPLGEMRPEADQLPGSCKNWLSVGRWMDVSNETHGVTWVTMDAPLVEIGGITATMLGSQTNPKIWREHVEPTQTFYSWAINNHWGTNYRA